MVKLTAKEQELLDIAWSHSLKSRDLDGYKSYLRGFTLPGHRDRPEFRQALNELAKHYEAFYG